MKENLPLFFLCAFSEIVRLAAFQNTKKELLCPKRAIVYNDFVDCNIQMRIWDC